MMYQPLICRIKVAEDNYNDEVRVKLNLFKVEKVNYVKEGQVRDEQSWSNPHVCSRLSFHHLLWVFT
jgi:hypothetical protein